MPRKPLYMILITVLLFVLEVACFISPRISEIVVSTTITPQASEVELTSTIQPTEREVVPSPTEQETKVTATEVIDQCTNTSDPCECLGKKYEYDKSLGEIKEEYIGSWHAAASVGSGYNERYVFFPTGNYLFFPSQYECDINDSTCIPSPIEQGIWGIQDSQMNLAKDGDINHVRSVLIGKVIDFPPNESPIH